MEVSNGIKTAAVVLNISTAVLILIVIFSAIAISIVTLASLAMCAVGVLDIVKFAKKVHKKRTEAQELKIQAAGPALALEQEPAIQGDGPAVDIHRVVEFDYASLQQVVLNSPGDCVSVYGAQVAQYVGCDYNTYDGKAVAVNSVRSGQMCRVPVGNFNSIGSAYPPDSQNCDQQEYSDQQSDALYYLTRREDSSSADDRVVSVMRFYGGGRPEFSFMPAGGAPYYYADVPNMQNSMAEGQYCENSMLGNDLISRQRRMENSIVGGVENSIIAQCEPVNNSENVSMSIEMSFRVEQAHEGMDNSIGGVYIANSIAVSNADLSLSYECAPTHMEDMDMREIGEYEAADSVEQAIPGNEYPQDADKREFGGENGADVEDSLPPRSAAPKRALSSIEENPEQTSSYNGVLKQSAVSANEDSDSGRESASGAESQV